MTRDPSDTNNLPPWLRNAPLPPRPPAEAAGLAAPIPASPVTPPAPGLPDWLSEPDTGVLAPGPAGADEGLPAWLRDTNEPAAQNPAPPQEPVPDWLGTSATPPPSGPAASEAFPAWLSESDEAESASAPEPSTLDMDADSGEGLPDWLRSLSDTPPAQAPAPTPEPAPEPARPRGSGFTGWLSSIGDEPSAPAPPPATPRQPAPATPPPQPAAAGSESDLPAWLRGADQSSAPEDEASAPLPDWLRSLEPTGPSEPTQMAPPSWQSEQAAQPQPPAQPSAEPDVDIPGWLRAAGDDPEPPAAAPSPGAEPAADEGMPAWLRNISEDDKRRVSPEDDLGVAPFTLEGDEPSSPAAPDTGDIPAWLAAEGEQPRSSGEATEWLAASASQLINAPEEPTPPADIPPWLAAEGEQPRPSGEAAGDIPPWLAAEGEQPRSSGEATEWLAASASQLINAPEEPTPPADIPPWLATDDQPAGQPLASSQDLGAPAWQSGGAGSPPGEDMPDWLRDVAAAPEQRPTEDMPAWLRESAPETPGARPPDDLPDWLRDTAAAQAAPPELPPARPAESAPAPTPPASPDALPPWLRDESGEPLPTAVAPGDTNLPAWLRGSDVGEPAQAAAPSAPNGSAAAPAAPPNLDWFGDEQAPAAPQTPSELLGGADLPAWLRRETEKPRDTNPTDARALDWLSRLGGYDDEAPAVAVEAAPRLTLPVTPPRSAAQLEALALLRHMAAEPIPAAAPAAEPVPANPLKRLGFERGVSLLLLILVAVGLIVPGLSESLAGPASAPGAAELFEQAGALTENDIVLIGYEWDAQRISELRPLEQAVLDELITRKVGVVLVSTDPQGTMLQFDLSDKLRANDYQLGGTDYVLLGYRPGGEIGLRQLAQDLRGALSNDFYGRDATVGELVRASDPPLNSLNDFAMVLVFADEPGDVQAWMEQVRPATTKPMAFLVPASVEPFAQPYFRTANTYHLGGIQGALAYQQLTGGSVGESAARQAGQLRLATLVFAALLAGGVVIGIAREAAARRRSPA